MSKIHELAFNAEEIDELLDSVDKKTIYQDATQSEHGLMSTTDKTKLDALPTAQQIDSALNAKVDKVEGKGLSKNDYTDEDKSKVASALQSETDPTVPSWAKQSTKPSYDYSEIGNTPDLSGFITKSVNDLTNYYLKSETYTKEEVAALIGAIQQFHYEIYATLPQTGQGNVLYLIGPTGSGSDKYEEYVYANNTWNKIGDTSIDLSGYVTTSALNTALADYTTTSNLTALLSNKADKVSNATSGNFAGLDANGNLTDSGKKASDFATASQGAKADTAYQKPSSGIPESDLSSDVQSQLNKHFKGWYASSGELPANPVFGDYAYVKGAESTDPTAIYECTTVGSWSDSGRTADTSNVQTFATGEEVNETYIDNTHLANPAGGALPTAADVLQLKAKLDGVTAEETKIGYIDGSLITGHYVGSGGTTSGTSSNYDCATFNVENSKNIRFLGVELSSSSTDRGYAFYDNDGNYIAGSYSQYDTASDATGKAKEYIVAIPQGAKYFKTNVRISTLVTSDNFYCYLQKGESAGGVLSKLSNVIANIALSPILSAEGYIDEIGVLHVAGSSHQKYNVFDVSSYKGGRFKITSDSTLVFAFLKNSSLVVGETPSYSEDYFGRQVSSSAENTIEIPLDCNYLYVYVGTRNTPINIVVKGWQTDNKVNIIDLHQCSFYKNEMLFMTRFQVACEVAHTQQTNWDEVPINTINASAIYKDNCVLYLPSQYSANGKPTKLIVFCKQGSSKIGINNQNDWAKKKKGNSPVSSLPFMPYLMSIGYAVLAVDGEPDGWIESLNLGNPGTSEQSDNEADFRCYGNYVAVQSAKRAYDFVTNKYNIDTNGVFVFGYSQGGLLAQNIVDLSGIPVLAVAEISPSCSLHWQQWDAVGSPKTIGNVSDVTRTARLILSRMYGFGDDITTNDQLLAMPWDSIKDKLIGYDPYTRNVDNEFTQFTADSSGIYHFSEGVTVDDVDMVKKSAAPLKVWLADGDETLGEDVTKAFVKAIKNGGGVADIVVYPRQAISHAWFNYQEDAGTCVIATDTEYAYKPIALDIASWYRSFGGY